MTLQIRTVKEGKGLKKYLIEERCKTKLTTLLVLYAFVSNSLASEPSINDESTLRVATFNVSMDATNYLPEGNIGTGIELIEALKNNKKQIPK